MYILNTKSQCTTKKNLFLNEVTLRAASCHGRKIPYYGIQRKRKQIEALHTRIRTEYVRYTLNEQTSSQTHAS